MISVRASEAIGEICGKVFQSEKLRGIKKEPKSNITFYSEQARIFFFVKAYCLKGISEQKAKRDKKVREKLELFFKI